jgi:ribulose-5-phosphate 4-epimerase/fuculose-1-phosphate aldolase
MAHVLPIKKPSLRERVSAEEWNTRVDLAACYRLVALYGMTDLVYNHITARVPGSEEHVLINPYGMLYDEITASSLIKINLAGETVLQPDHDYSVNAAGYVIHSAVHTARHDAECVIHTHTRAGTAVSALADGLMPLSQTAMRFSGHLAYHEYEGPAFNRGERERLIADLGNKNAMILRNHGLLVCAPSIPQAFNLIYWLEQACKREVGNRAAHYQLLQCLKRSGNSKVKEVRAIQERLDQIDEATTRMHEIVTVELPAGTQVGQALLCAPRLAEVCESHPCGSGPDPCAWRNTVDNRSARPFTHGSSRIFSCAPDTVMSSTPPLANSPQP